MSDARSRTPTAIDENGHHSIPGCLPTGSVTNTPFAPPTGRTFKTIEISTPSIERLAIDTGRKIPESVTGKTYKPDLAFPPEEDLTFGATILDRRIKETNPKDIAGGNKAPMSTVSAVVMAELGVAMLEGTCKYGRHNYRETGVLSSVYYDAAKRHLQAWWEGQDIDADSELSHITKAIATLVVLRDAMIFDKLEDDRPPKAPEGFFENLNKLSVKVREKYKHLHPKHIREKY